tara:strand:- start:1085 stop:1258 length:174 start_codon:yes stop_codon:yes gene_type:complete
MKKYKHTNLKGNLILIKKWSKNGIEKCKVEDEEGYEHIVSSENLKEIKTKSNKNKKK